MSTENQSPQKKEKGTSRFWRVFRRPLVYVIILAVVWRLTVIHYLLCGFIPPIRHDGVELYESGKYLKYEEGESFEEYMDALPFAEDAEIISFTYYDFCLRNNIFEGEFPDAYLMQISPKISFDEMIQHLETQAEDIWINSTCTLYKMNPNKADVSFCVAVNCQRQEVYCFMVTQSDDIYDSYRFFWIQLGATPWE